VSKNQRGELSDLRPIGSPLLPDPTCEVALPFVTPIFDRCAGGAKKILLAAVSQSGLYGLSDKAASAPRSGDPVDLLYQAFIEINVQTHVLNMTQGA
jgi:hypothetical protein